MVVDSKNNVSGAIGAFLGALLGAIPWGIVYSFGWFVGWLGLVIGLCASKGYTLFRGKSGYVAAIIVAVAVIFGVIVGQALGEGFEVAKMIFEGELDAPHAAIPLILLYSLFDESEIFWDMFKNFGLGLFFAFLGAWGIIKNMIAGSKPVNGSDSAVEGMTQSDKS